MNDHYSSSNDNASSDRQSSRMPPTSKRRIHLVRDFPCHILRHKSAGARLVCSHTFKSVEHATQPLVQLFFQPTSITSRSPGPPGSCQHNQASVLRVAPDLISRCLCSLPWQPLRSKYAIADCVRVSSQANVLKDAAYSRYEIDMTRSQA
ncbi:hypothetical protein PHSY_001511 [Pseudozyma hubeiensis SY62]|uniref:Uncharacterized protein n=1 Tax=Pseudozyma hubeiensis (strain SY62) TaxID=1305764 RepID=R9NZ44_PSEHS|nr:hypothetical protein PHSY_001511 [Pseudozyma hubeiensis SY62]GAC93942.1 hypothetical protein PHSY_001511 [Pseudozyma hubeiensis SY62]